MKNNPEINISNYEMIRLAEINEAVRALGELISRQSY